MDVTNFENRSYNMSQIKAKNTKPEQLVRKYLWNNGYRYRLHYKKLPGKPDIVFLRKKKVIFINGCFWHKHDCKYFQWPQTNEDFWKNKITGNVMRDKKNIKALKDLGWDILIIWECELKRDSIDKTLHCVLEFLENA